SLAEILLDLAERTVDARKAALLVQTAVVHEIATIAPLRCANLVSLRLNHNLRFQGKGHHRMATLSIPAEEVKNGLALEYELPPRTTRLLERYLNKHRSTLIQGTDEGWLFPGKNGHKHQVALSEQLRRAIARHIGITVNPH